jgi:hypothetical protein
MGKEALQQHGWVNNEDVKQPLRRPGTMSRDQMHKDSPFPQKRGCRNTGESFMEREAMP